MFKKRYRIHFDKIIEDIDDSRYVANGTWILNQLYKLHDKFSFKVVETYTQGLGDGRYCYVDIKCKQKDICAITHLFAVAAQTHAMNFGFERNTWSY
jgi:hypothetical protein